MHRGPWAVSAVQTNQTGRAEQLPRLCVPTGWCLALSYPTPRAVLEGLGLSADGFLACALVEQCAQPFAWGWVREFVALL